MTTSEERGREREREGGGGKKVLVLWRAVRIGTISVVFEKTVGAGAE